MNTNYLFSYLFGILACFFSDVVGREAIIGGQYANFNDFRYQVIIMIADLASNCGGGILTEDSVITAAHCVIRDNLPIGTPTSALVGTADLSLPGIVVKATKIFIPAEYKGWLSMTTGDIAILKLKSRLDLKSYGLKRLYTFSARRPPFEDQKAIIAGIGWDMVFKNMEQLGFHTDNRLRFAEAIVHNQTQCKSEHSGKMISIKHMCARVKSIHNNTHHHNERRGVCIGDAGGPLVYDNLYVIGILSVSTDGCSEAKSSGIYTPISEFRTFIKNAINNVSSSYMRVFNL